MKPIADALELLTEQHEDVSAALTALARTDRGDLAQALGALADRIATHLAVEEQFLATLGLAIPTTDHDELRADLAELLATDMASPAMAARLQAFTARWDRHATAQEQQIFVALAETLAPHVLADIGTRLGAMAEQSRCVAA